MFPHELLNRYIKEIIGERSRILGPLADDLIAKVAHGLADQLSIYMDCIPSADFTIDSVRIKEGAERSYLMMGVLDRGKPLHVKSALAYWHPELVSSKPEDFVEAVNSRRWRFVTRFRAFIYDVFRRICDELMTYYERRPYAVVSTAQAVHRVIEGDSATYWVLELDDRSTSKVRRTTDYNIE